MAAPISSLEKKVRTKLQIPGTRPSLANSQLLVSTGIPSLDTLLGGGIAVGTILLIEEDKYGSYSGLMLKLFLADACAHKHSVFIASNDTSPQSILSELPSSVSYDRPDTQPSSSNETVPVSDKDPIRECVTNSEDERIQQDKPDLHIAWRYQNLKLQKPLSSKPSFGLYFDLSKPIDAETLGTIDASFFSSCSSDRKHDQSDYGVSMNQSYQSLLQAVSDRISTGQFDTNTQSEHKSILRIGIHSLGSPYWMSDESVVDKNDHGDVKRTSSSSYSLSLLRCLYGLRALMRSAYAACVVTIPHLVFLNTSHAARIRNLCDAVVRLESFADTPLVRHELYKEYHGMFHIVKSPRVNSLSRLHVDTDDLMFKLRRKRFTIEKMHLPPALEENISSDARQKSSDISTATTDRVPMSMGCGTGLNKNKLDF